MPVTDVRVDDEGIFARSAREVILDVCFDGRRIWSFWLQRDGAAVGSGHLVAWPESLRDYLDGTTRLSLNEHGHETALYDAEVRLGTGEARIAVVDKQGNPLALDKDNRRVKTFAGRNAEHVRPLMDAIEEVLAALGKVGIEGFLAYGTLLGAVRGGRLIGHDSDADLGYVSSHTEPADVVLESFRIQRDLTSLGYRITRYSGAAFKILVPESDGSLRGLDVFGGFLREGHLHLMGEIRARFEREWIFPLGTATLEDREFPVPADTDRFLAITYGPRWRTPDPAFKFETPRSTVRRLSGWFRGIRTSRKEWDRAYAQRGYGRGKGPSALLQRIHDREQAPASYVDIGCGRGRDVSAVVAWHGVPSLGLDVHPRAFRLHAERHAENDGVRFWTFNLLERRHHGAVAAYAGVGLPAPRLVTARHLIDAIEPEGAPVERLAELARPLLVGGAGRLHLEFLVRWGDDGYGEELRLAAALDPDAVAAMLERAGARVLERELSPVSDEPGASITCHLVADWPARTPGGN
ncbi:hypothetical protein P5P86_16125 [Nocardioides sp. BP30]|uniref:hypothetical protein n=1 Tax=Nocardioides sp. BP30 TaxID=3036374 RepID=UPI002468AD4E|nr:hypothetical protein [Nocardioides sp. BP30]WGL51481.1 hypothetical protein P5P86_16125 [Nocardioides sp. BP30]